MNKSSLLYIAAGFASISSAAQAADLSKYFSMDAQGFKRFSVSAGALHVMPQGKAQPFTVNTAIYEGYEAKVGSISTKSVMDNRGDSNQNLANSLVDLLNKIDNNGKLPAFMSGTAKVYGLESWDNPGTGLEADDVTTLGLMSSYFFTDHISIEMKAGIPPKVDLMGQGKIYAPFSAISTPLASSLIGKINLQNDMLITDLGAYGPAASARAWTPAFEFQYHFGKSGVNKFRPYLGLGIMYAYFNELEMNPRIEQDLIAAGHMIANIKNDKAGAALDGTVSSANPQVDLEATDAFAPIISAGFTYDFNDRWFAAASISYAQLKNETTITVNDAKLGELIRSKADIEVNPLLIYAGFGVRF